MTTDNKLLNHHIGLYIEIPQLIIQLLMVFLFQFDFIMIQTAWILLDDV